jgi:acyl carrier protein
VNKGDGHLEELFTKEFSMEELQEAIKTSAIRSNQDMTKYSHKLLKTLDQRL